MSNKEVSKRVLKDVIQLVMCITIAVLAYSVGQDKGRLTFYEELHGEKLECRLTADQFVTDALE